MTMFHDTETGLFPTADDVFARFMASAEDAQQERWFARRVFESALAGNDEARELVEDTCGVEFL